MNIMSIPPRALGGILGTEYSAKGFIADFLMPILPKIIGEPTKEFLIDILQLISSNTASMDSNL